jgi:tRNA (cytidine/uridine-2'-O-)-methyltransferase
MMDSETDCEIVDHLTVALIEPEIPGNTGSIARTCVATETPLVIVGPIPFEITDARLRRAGLDYWPYLDFTFLENFKSFQCIYGQKRLVLTSARLGTPYHKFCFLPDDILVFGKETLGLPKELLADKKNPVVTLPMWGKTRSLNIANACTTLLYEAYRQIGIPETDSV